MSAKEVKLKGSGGYVFAKLKEEQIKKADLGAGELFLAPVGRLGDGLISKYFCKKCNKEFSSNPKIISENPNEMVAEKMMLVERGQYACSTCNSIIGEYRQFKNIP